MEDKELIAKGLVHSLHTSERRSFRSCRRRWSWVFREYYYPRVTAPPLEFGVAFHAAMEVWYDPMFWDHPDHDIVQSALAKTTFTKLTNEQFTKYKKLNGPPSDEIKAEYHDRVKLGLDMIEYYATAVSPFIDFGFKPIAVEIPFEVPLGFRCKCDICWKKFLNYWNARLDDYRKLPLSERVDSQEDFKGLPVTYGGRIDMIAEDDIGRLWLFDWKTTSRMIDESQQASFLELDDQITSYCAGLLKLGRSVAGFVWHEQLKAVPSPPEPLVRPLKGRLFSVSKNAATTYPIFKRHVAENDIMGLENGLYDEYLMFLQKEGPRFYQRHQVHRTKTQLTNAWSDLVSEAKDIIGNPRIYPQPGRFSCTTCAFQQPCLGKNMGEDYEYALNTMFERRSKHYYEEKEVSTDK